MNCKLSIFDVPEFVAPQETLEESLIQAVKAPNYEESEEVETSDQKEESKEMDCKSPDEESSTPIEDSISAIETGPPLTDEEKAAASLLSNRSTLKQPLFDGDRPFLDAICNALNCDNHLDDHSSVFALCLIYATIHNSGTLSFNILPFREALIFTNFIAGVKEQLVQNLLIPTTSYQDSFPCYSGKLLNHLIEIMRKCCQYSEYLRVTRNHF